MNSTPQSAQVTDRSVYVTGWDLPFDLPFEELTFFLVIPICSLLTLEAVRRVLNRD